MAGGQLSLTTKGDPGNSGAPGATGVGAQGIWTPADNGLVAANMDPSNFSTNTVLTAGVLYLQKVKMATDSAVASIALSPRSPSGAGLANTFAGIYTISGTTATLIASTADVSTQMQTSSEQKFNLTAPTSVLTAGTELFIGILVGSGSTLPTLQGLSGRSNAFRTGAGRRILASGSGQTALPSTVNLSTATDSVSLFAGLSA